MRIGVRLKFALLVSRWKGSCLRGASFMGLVDGGNVSLDNLIFSGVLSQKIKSITAP